jgi:ADP-ribose pyrophosphatase YjhB (NUDIX family)
MHEWLVASGIVEGPGGVLLVQNRRRDGALDWSPPGGVVEVADGESVVDGLTREVEAFAPDMGWHLRVEVHRALEWTGELEPDDPDGIVIDARFVPIDECETCRASTWIPTHEPLLAWLTERWATGARPAYRYTIAGASRAGMTITRL